MKEVKGNVLNLLSFSFTAAENNYHKFCFLIKGCYFSLQEFNIPFLY